MSMPRRILLAATTLSVAALLGLSACGDDNPTGSGGGTPQEQEALALVNEVVVPLLQTLTLQNYLNLGGIPLQNCTPLGICTSGSAESCIGETGQTITFTSCRSNGQTVNGTVTIQGNEVAGQGTFSLTIDDLTMSGAVSYAVEGACFFETFSNVAVMLGNKTYSMFGSLDFCQVFAPGARPEQETAVPTGGALTLFESTTSMYYQIDFNTESGTPGDYFLFGFQGETPVVACEGNVLGGVECYDPNEYQL